MNKLNNILSSIKKNSFFFLLGLGVIFFLPITFSSLDLMGGNDCSLPLWFIIVSFVLSLSSFVFLMANDLRKDKNRFHYFVGVAIILLIIYSALIIFIQNSEIIVTVRVYYSKDDHVGHMVDILTTITSLDKTVFFMQTVLIFIIIYIGLFLFPKHVNDINWLFYFALVICSLVFITIVYSLIAEFDRYITVFKDLFGIEKVDGKILDYCPKSIYGHKNIYGLALVVASLHILIMKAFKKHKYLMWVYVFFGVVLIFSQCRAGIIVYLLMTLVYVYYLLIRGIKENKHNYKIVTIVLSSTLSVLLIVFVFLGIFYEPLKNKIINMFDSGETFVGRINIWRNALYSLQPDRYLLGRGYGIFNKVLLNVNYEARRDYTYSSHGWFMAMIGRGGLVYFISFIAFIVYTLYIFIKSYHLDKDIIFSIFLSFVSLLVFACFEDFYYAALFMALELSIARSALTHNQVDNLINS